MTVANGGGTGATARASGAVDAVTIGDGGAGYTMPTVEFGLPDLPDGVQATGHVEQADIGATGDITKVVVDNPGSGYLTAPDVVVRNGTIFDPVNTPDLAQAATTSTLKLDAVTPVDVGTGYTAPPDVAVADVAGGTGTGATVTATTDVGALTGVTMTADGSGYLSKGIKKFTDALPNVCAPGTDGTGRSSDPAVKQIPLGVPETRTYTNDGVAQESDVYEIGLVQYRTRFSSSMPEGALVRGYVQLSTTASRGSTSSSSTRCSTAPMCRPATSG